MKKNFFYYHDSSDSIFKSDGEMDFQNNCDVIEVDEKRFYEMKKELKLMHVSVDEELFDEIMSLGTDYNKILNIISKLMGGLVQNDNYVSENVLKSNKILLIKLKKQLNEESSNISKRIIKYWVKIINSIKNDKENE